MDISNYKLGNAKAREGDPDLFKNVPPAKEEFDRAYKKHPRVSYAILLAGIVLMIPLLNVASGSMEMPLWIIILFQFVFASIWAVLHGFIMFFIRGWYSCTSENNTDKFNLAAKEITEGEKKDQLVTYMNHENFMNREPVLAEVRAIKKIAHQESRLRARQEAEQNLSGSRDTAAY